MSKGEGIVAWQIETATKSAYPLRPRCFVSAAPLANWLHLMFSLRRVFAGVFAGVGVHALAVYHGSDSV
jgi:hypothetical protein